MCASTGEKARITAAGGFVDFGRVNGNLALSRAIGDFEFKKSPELAPEQQIVTAYPDVVVHEMGDDDEFLVIACDGKSTERKGRAKKKKKGKKEKRKQKKRWREGTGTRPAYEILS